MNLRGGTESPELPVYPAADRRRTFWRRVIVVLCALFVLSALGAGGYAFRAIRRSDAADAVRDRWQRPGDVLAHLNLRPGGVAADLGCGSGYYSLKMSPAVGVGGRVLGVDIRWAPLVLLKSRAVLRGMSNVEVVRAGGQDPRLPAAAVDAVLIVNAYHEMPDRDATLAYVRTALLPGGRLVIVDQKPTAEHEAHVNPAEHHEMPIELAEAELRRAGFSLLARDERFAVNPSSGDIWWLLTAARP